MKSVKLVSALIVVVIFGGWFMLNTLTQFVPIGQVGVRIQQYNMFGKKGVVKKDFGPGWHRDLGPIDNWELYDSTLHTLEMTKDPNRGSTRGQDDVKVQSIDGNSLSLDVTVKYRIMPGKANRLFLDTGRGSKYMTFVRNQSESSSMRYFGQMKTEDFYNPAMKRQASKLIKTELTTTLAKNFIQVIDVLIRDVSFDLRYEKEIRRKKLADQEVELNKSMGAAAEMRGKTQVIEAQTKKLVNIIIKEKEAELISMEADADLQITKIKAEADKFVTEKRADADLFVAENEAEGERKVRTAEAEGERLRNEALLGSGGDVMVALEAARSLNIKEATISTMNIDLLNVDAMVETLGLPPAGK
jgi:regulator of protease activity HflC (stomatin/prohibitin superfamily)